MKSEKAKISVVQLELDQEIARVLGLQNDPADPQRPAAHDLYLRHPGPTKLAWYVNSPAMNNAGREGNQEK